MRIYVAGALNAMAIDYIKNIHRMMTVGIALRRKGHCPYVPALDVLLGIMAGDWDYEDYIGMNMPFVDVCEAFFLICHSPGTDRELARADALNKIIYTKLEDVPDEPR